MLSLSAPIPGQQDISHSYKLDQLSMVGRQFTSIKDKLRVSAKHGMD